MRKTPEQRYFENVEIKEGCWGWRAATNRKGYGRFYSKHTQSAHRFSWIIHKGKIPDGLFVLHKCDNPPCTNPEHLFLGTNLDNIRDMIAKGRNYKFPKKKKCSRGHEYTSENTLIVSNRRRCKKCTRAYHKNLVSRLKISDPIRHRKLVDYMIKYNKQTKEKNRDE